MHPTTSPPGQRIAPGPPRPAPERMEIPMKPSKLLTIARAGGVDARALAAFAAITLGATIVATGCGDKPAAKTPVDAKPVDTAPAPTSRLPDKAPDSPTAS